jgi:uncharacterized protein YecT (DUF1311 family)
MRRVVFALLGLLLTATPALSAVKLVDRKADQKTKDYEISFSYPVTGVKAVDDVLGKFARDKLAGYKSSGKEHEEDRSMAAYDFELGYTVQRNDDQVLSVLFSESTYTGGAHPNTFFYSFNFLMPDGAQIFLPEILERGGLKRLSDYAIKDLQKQLGNDEGIDQDWLRRGAGPLATNYDVFSLKRDAIEIEFPAYQVAAYVYGPQEVTVPISVLKGFIRKDWRAPQASFDCAKAKTAIEKSICGSAALARLDRQTAEQYASNLANAYEKSEADKWLTTQRAWQAARDKTCADGNAACLTKSYSARLAQLKKYEAN